MVRVLYVDDEYINLNLFEISFRKDFSIFKTLSAKEAIDIYKNNDIDVVITDLKMPEMDGIEFIREIKRIKPEQNCILLTAYYEPKLIRDPDIKSIIYKYVVKPFKKTDLRNLIEEAKQRNAG
ncbi:MAG TPA: two-component system response regulator [Bacteroidales bacterium]|jgi:two-component system response regulator (stage 0 sporulation protein F)|nr:two-component system response regulator [Bacteroidales bacterium]